MAHMPTDSLSYTNKLQSPQKLLLMISTEGLMVAAMAGICCSRNELNEFKFFSWKKVISKEVSDTVSLWLLLCRHSHSLQWQAGRANMRKLDSLWNGKSQEADTQNKLEKDWRTSNSTLAKNGKRTRTDRNHAMMGGFIAWICTVCTLEDSTESHPTVRIWFCLAAGAV